MGTISAVTSDNVRTRRQNVLCDETATKMQPEVTGRSVPNKYRLQTTLTSINYRLPWDTAYANFIQTIYIAENSAMSTLQPLVCTI